MDDRHTPPHPACLLRWDLVNFLLGLAPNHDPSLPPGITGVRHWTLMCPFFFFYSKEPGRKVGLSAHLPFMRINSDFWGRTRIGLPIMCLQYQKRPPGGRCRLLRTVWFGLAKGVVILVLHPGLVGSLPEGAVWLAIPCYTCLWVSITSSLNHSHLRPPHLFSCPTTTQQSLVSDWATWNPSAKTF
jgi:hypothetical protein